MSQYLENFVHLKHSHCPGQVSGNLNEELFKSKTTIECYFFLFIEEYLILAEPLNVLQTST